MDLSISSAIADGSCFFHALCQALDPRYASASQAKKSLLATSLRAEMVNFLLEDHPDQAQVNVWNLMLQNLWMVLSFDVFDSQGNNLARRFPGLETDLETFPHLADRIDYCCQELSQYYDSRGIKWTLEGLRRFFNQDPRDYVMQCYPECTPEICGREFPISLNYFSVISQLPCGVEHLSYSLPRLVEFGIDPHQYAADDNIIPLMVNIYKINLVIISPFYTKMTLFEPKEASSVCIALFQPNQYHFDLIVRGSEKVFIYNTDLLMRLEAFRRSKYG